jgi:hypothetical protein
MIEYFDEANETKAILALGDMMRKAGFDPDTGGRIGR